MKFLILGDLHGQKPNIYFKNFDAILAPGDFCSYDKIRKPIFKVIKKRMQEPNYEKNWYDLTGKRKARKLVSESIESGRKVLQYIDSLNVPVFIVPGNVDSAPKKDSEWDFLKQNHYKKMLAGLKNVKDVHQKLASYMDYNIIGYGVSSGPEKTQHKEDLLRKTPLELGTEKRKYDKLSKKMSSLFDKATNPVIFLSHNVPFNTRLDKITIKDSPRHGYHYGSLITREMVETYQPLVCAGGHMHEHFGKTNLGETVCINSGFGSNVNVLLELDKKRIKKIKFHKNK